MATWKLPPQVSTWIQELSQVAACQAGVALAAARHWHAVRSGTPQRRSSSLGCAVWKSRIAGLPLSPFGNGG